MTSSPHHHLTVTQGFTVCPSNSVALGLGVHTNTGRSLEGRGHGRSVSQSFLKEKAVEHSESLKTCTDGASKTHILL